MNLKCQYGHFQRMRMEGFWVVVTEIHVISLLSQAASRRLGGRVEVEFVPGNESSTAGTVSMKLCS